MWDFFINNRRFSFLLIFVLIGFGLYSIVSIPKESAPEVQVPIGIITTLLPGAPAIDVESLVTNEIERGLSGSLEDVKSITSTSRDSVSSVVVEFNASADIDESISDLKDKVDTLINDLPDDAERPSVSELNFVDQPFLSVAFSGELSDREFSDLANDLEDKIEAVAGISRVEKSGIREPEVTVLVDQTALLNFNLTINDVINGIRIANSVFPVGQIVSDNVTYNIVFEGDIENIEAVSSIPISVRNGQPVFVRDVAEVILGLSPVNSFSRLSIANLPSENSFVLSIYKRRGGDVTVLSDNIKALLEKENETSLQNVHTYIIQDAGELVKKDLIQLSTSGIQTIILVIIALIITIGWREGLIAGLAIPLSFMIGFIGLYLSGNTINFISLFALILGIGVLVDSGIVVVEGINKKLKADPNTSKVEAAKETIAEFSSPLISGTLTTVSMFTGLFVVSGVTGQFIASIPFTLIFVLFASLLVALGFLPLITTVFLRRKDTNKLELMQSKYSHIVEDWYRRTLTKIINSGTYKKRFLAFLIVGFISAIALVPLGFVKVIFFEQSDVDELYVEIKLPEGSIKESTDIVVRQVEEILYQEDLVEAFSATVGSGSAFASGGQNAKLANFYLSLNKDRDISSTEFLENLRPKLDAIYGADITVNQPSDGPPGSAPLAVKLFGDDLEDLTQAATVVSKTLSEIDHVVDISTDTDANSTEFTFTLDRAKAAAVGLTPQAISQTLRSAVFGSTATEITTSQKSIDVVARLNLDSSNTTDPEFANRTNIDRLENIEITTPNGQKVLLSSLVDTSLREASTAIRHEDQKRLITVSADITKEGNVIEINGQLQGLLDSEVSLPAGVTYSLGGESEDSNQAFLELFLALVVGVVLMVGVLVLQFDSYRHTFYVLSILPFSLIGILYGLAITDSALSFPSIMGFIALSGIIVNNSILLIDMMNQSRKQDSITSINEVVIESAVQRLRPILLTSFTTILGMMPLLFTDEVWIPLATAIIFGLMFSVIITLILIPVIYSKWPGTLRR